MVDRISRAWISLCALLMPAVSSAQPADAVSRDTFRIVTVAETRIGRLPPGPLYWRVENFSSLAKAKAASGPMALAADASGRAWLLTLGPKGAKTSGGRFVAEIGPVPPMAAPEYLLRINHAGGPPGAKTPIHSHPGSEAFHVLAGRLCQKTSHGEVALDAGGSMNGHEPGMVMQLASCGSVDLDQLVMFVVDATKPFAPPASQFGGKN